MFVTKDADFHDEKQMCLVSAERIITLINPSWSGHYRLTTCREDN